MRKPGRGTDRVSLRPSPRLKELRTSLDVYDGLGHLLALRFSLLLQLRVPDLPIVRHWPRALHYGRGTPLVAPYLS